MSSQAGLPAVPLFAPSLFIERMIRFLLPYFASLTPDLALARAEIIETLASYGPRTRAEMLNAAQIIAFGFAALETLEEAKASDLSPSMRLRTRGCANNLNRSCQRNEKSLAAQLSRDVPPAPQPHAEPIDDIPDADAAEIIRMAETTIETYRNGVAASRRPTGPQPVSTAPTGRPNRAWGGAMVDALAGIEMPVQLTPAAANPGAT